MVKYIIASVLSLLIMGCGSTIVKTEVVKQYIPLLYCPAPPSLVRPSLPIYDITASTSDGEVAKKYKASVIILQGYVEELEKTVNEYDKTNKAYSELRNRFKTQWKQELQNIKTESK